MGVVSIRLSDAEKQKLDKLAAGAGMKRGEYIKDVILKKVFEKEDAVFETRADTKLVLDALKYIIKSDIELAKKVGEIAKKDKNFDFVMFLLKNEKNS